jgi:hypothetical protein
MELTAIEEDLLENWIVDLDLCGKTPTYMMVKDMAKILLAERLYYGNIINVGKNWVYRYIKRRGILKPCFYVDIMYSVLYVRIRRL